MNYNTPIFIRLHSAGVEEMINVQYITGVTPYTDMITHVYMTTIDEPLCVDESCEEIQKKLLNVAIIL